MSYQLRLGVICRFTDSTDVVHWVKVETFKEAAQKIKTFCDKECFEDWQLLGGDIKDEDGNIIAIMSEHGDAYQPSSEGNLFYERLPDFNYPVSY